MAGEAWRQELEVSGHIAPTVRKQEEVYAGAQLTSSFLFGPGSQSMEGCHPHSGCLFPSQLNLFGNSLTYIKIRDMFYR